MKKFLFAALLLVFIGVTANFAQAGGRLNFMLINTTNQPIVSARICPTYKPYLLSGNLLKSPLAPYSQVYIGPNFYGQEKNWSIVLKWANGYEKEFPYMRLTRYNTYQAWVRPYGDTGLRQSFEPAFAYYSFPTGLPTYALGNDPNMNVVVSAPQPVQMAQNYTAQNTMASPGGSNKSTTRDLVFEDDEESAPNVAGSAANDVKGEKIAMKATVELTRDGKTSTVLPSEDFKSGDKVRLLFSTNRDGHIYWLAQGTSGEYQVLFPTEKTGMDNSVTKNKEYTVPFKGAWRFDDKKGTETLVAVLSPNSIPELDKAVKLASAGDKAGASSIVQNIVNSHEKKRTTTRDLVFEEEDDADVNTKSQKANGDEPFVATYELTHN